MFTGGSDDQYQPQGYANPVHSADAHGRRRRGPGTHVDRAPLQPTKRTQGRAVRALNAKFWREPMLARVFLMAITALLLSGCVDSERLREGLGGPKGHDTAEGTPGK